MQQQRELRRLGRLGEDQEERITGRADLFGFFESSEEIAEQGVMLLDQCDGAVITEILLQLGGADQIGEEQGQQPDPMLALEFLNLEAVV